MREEDTAAERSDCGVQVPEKSFRYLHRIPKAIFRLYGEKHEKIFRHKLFFQFRLPADFEET